jgi:hypothetical protein
MNRWLEVLAGLVLIIATVSVALFYPSWGQATLAVLKGGVVCFVGMIGILFLLLGISDLRE